MHTNIPAADTLACTSSFPFPNLYAQAAITEGDEAAWTAATQWDGLRDFWVERLLPHLRDELGVQAIGVVGTGWGAWVATRLSSYGEVIFIPHSPSWHPTSSPSRLRQN